MPSRMRVEVSQNVMLSLVECAHVAGAQSMSRREQKIQDLPSQRHPRRIKGLAAPRRLGRWMHRFT